MLNRSKRVVLLTATLGLVACTSANADWQDTFNDVLEGVTNSQTGGGDAIGNGLGQTEIVRGLKEALAQGATKAVNQLGQTNGFWGDQLVKIAAPDQLNSITKTLRRIGQDKLVNEFELSLNRAAEKAVPEAAQILGDAIRGMTFVDAKAILQGDDQAATQFFQRTTTDQLFARLYPIVQESTSRTGVTQAYKNLLGEAGFLAGLVKLDAESLDRHVTDEALDGLFQLIGQEEQKIRDNPSARTTEILKEVFGG